MFPENVLEDHSDTKNTKSNQFWVICMLVIVMLSVIKLGWNQCILKLHWWNCIQIEQTFILNLKTKLTFDGFKTLFYAKKCCLCHHVIFYASPGCHLFIYFHPFWGTNSEICFVRFGDKEMSIGYSWTWYYSQRVKILYWLSTTEIIISYTIFSWRHCRNRP